MLFLIKNFYIHLSLNINDNSLNIPKNLTILHCEILNYFLYSILLACKILKNEIN